MCFCFFKRSPEEPHILKYGHQPHLSFIRVKRVLEGLVDRFIWGKVTPLMVQNSTLFSVSIPRFAPAFPWGEGSHCERGDTILLIILTIQSQSNRRSPGYPDRYVIAIAITLWRLFSYFFSVSDHSKEYYFSEPPYYIFLEMNFSLKNFTCIS